jgi:single-stranded-DNA-specific exonuclease
MLVEALKLAEEQPPLSSPIVLASENWFIGVAGIVASRLADKLLRPAVVICLSQGVGRGSCRSFGGFNIHAALDCQRDLLMSFGGHEMAAGLTIEQENIEELARKLTSAGGDEVCDSGLEVDFEVIKPGLLTLDNVTALSLLEPYGNGNPPPVLCIRKAQIEAASPISGGKHSKFRIYKNGESFDGVFFGRTVEEIGAKSGDFADIAFTPHVNEYRGRRTVQLYLTDMRVL